MQTYSHVSEDFHSAAVLHEWTTAAAATATTATIAQYYQLEGNQCPTKNVRYDFKHIETAFPRHYAIVAASRQPRQTRQCPLMISLMISSQIPPQHKIQSIAKARASAVEGITHFTELSVRQKNIVTAHSGLAHLLVKKLAGIFCAKPHTIRAALKHADIIASFISSALACEYLVGNRYYRNLPTILATELVGGTENARYAKFTAEDATPAKIQETEETLQALYDANIDRLESCADLYERGLVSLDAIRTDPEFVQMLVVFWKLNFQTMTARSISERRIAAVRANRSPGNDCDYYSENDAELAERLLACRQIFKCQCRFARLFQYRIAHIFDNRSFNYASLLRSAKSSHLRLCNDGMSTALLTFAAIEPRMVRAGMAPKLGIGHLACDASSIANHVQSRDPVFGHLLATHRQHIPRTNELFTGDGDEIRRQDIRRQQQYTCI